MQDRLTASDNLQVARLQAFKSDTNLASVNLTSAMDAFDFAATGVQDTQLAIGRMYARLMGIGERNSLSLQSLSSCLVSKILSSYMKTLRMQQSAGSMSLFSMQRISPILHQADGDETSSRQGTDVAAGTWE